MDGTELGISVGRILGINVGSTLGMTLGNALMLGIKLGGEDGLKVGTSVGEFDGEIQPGTITSPVNDCSEKDIATALTFIAVELGS